ncbi:MAG: hypothetical protein NXI20_26005, partial [bacterium]|nr:hypothetical protein [bacterium]
MKSLILSCLILSCFISYSQNPITGEDDYLDSIWTLSKANPGQALEQGHLLFANIDTISSNHQKRRVFWKYLGLFRKVVKHDTLLEIYEANIDK